MKHFKTSKRVALGFILFSCGIAALFPKTLTAERKALPDLEDDTLSELESSISDERIGSEGNSKSEVSDISSDDMLFLNQEEKRVPVSGNSSVIQEKPRPRPVVEAVPAPIAPRPATAEKSYATPSQAESTLLNEENIYSGKAVYTGKPIELLELKDTDIRDALRLIGKYSGYNMVIGEDVSGKVGALSLSKIPWDQAFSLVLQSKKLSYVKEGNVLRVATMNTLKAEKEEAAAAELSRVRVEPLKTMLIPISYAKASELSPRAKAFLSERGNIDVDDRSNTVVVRDVDKVLQRVKKLLTVLDTQPPSVSITAKVMEMSETLTRKFGFNLLNFNLHPTSGVSFDQTFTPSLESGRALLIRAENFANLEAQFQLSELDRDVKVLASPSMSVNQNSKGTIRHNVSFIRLVSGGVVNGQQQPSQFQSVNAELLMEATPVVASDGSISITLHVKNDVPTGDFGGSTGQVDTRDINTSLLLSSGDTAVIGGIFKNTVSNTLTGVPVLMHIPILGSLFSGRSKEVSRSEILIFLTAKITNAAEVFNKAL